MKERTYPRLSLLQQLAAPRHAAQVEDGIKRAEAAGCVVTRVGDEVHIAVPPGVDFDLRTMRGVQP